MSGLCGIIAFDPAAPVEGIDAMINAAPWRGPDGVGVWRGKGAVLAHQALHVTPESRYEDQPVVDEEAGLVLVADARIDNRDELLRTLRRDLRRTVRSDVITDPDLILAAYRRWGTDCAAHLLGDFAFAVWDQRQRQLFAARDPMAMRPFYYRIEENRVLFGSEVKQILAAPGVPREIFEPMVAMHLCGRFDRLDWTFFEGIAQLEPAHALVVTADGAHRTWRYWDIDPDHQIRYKNEQDYVEHFREIFKEAVRCRLRSHKPVGLLLSGGLDSGSIASMAGHLKETEGLPCPDFRTYSWKFPTLTQCDERYISDLICERYDLPATYIDAENAWPLKDFPAHGPDVDEPFLGVYQALLDVAVETARDDGISLVISGDRGDLAFGENIYDYTGLFWRGKWKTLFDELSLYARVGGISRWHLARRYLLSPAVQTLKPSARDHWVRKGYRTVRNTIGGKPKDLYPPWVSDKLRQIMKEVGQTRQANAAGKGYTLAKHQRYKALFVAMQMRGITRTERRQAMFGVGFADPWSDVRVARFAVAVSQRLLNHTGEEKRFTRRMVRGIMPEQARRRAGKIFPTPLYHQAMRERETDTVCSLLTDSLLSSRNFVVECKLVDTYRNSLDGQPGDMDQVWMALMAEAWLQKMMDPDHSSNP